MRSAHWTSISPIKDGLMLTSYQNNAEVTAMQFFDLKHGSLTTVAIISSSKQEADTALASLVSVYGSHNGTVERSDEGDKYSLSCCWQLPLSPWNTAYEQILGESKIEAICDRFSLRRDAFWAVHGALKTLEMCNPANRKEATMILLPQVGHLTGQELAVIDCAWEIKRIVDSSRFPG